MKQGQKVQPTRECRNAHWVELYDGKWPALIVEVPVEGYLFLQGKDGYWSTDGLELASPLSMENK